MLKKVIPLIISVLFLVNLYGCVALLAGAAGGAGTATWLSRKITQEVNAPIDKALEASKSAFKSLKLDISKETIKDEVAQIIGKYTDGRTVWVDIHRLTQSTSRIEVRVGAWGDKEATREILDKILRYL